ncbi:MAG: hypothetical protein MZV70_16205 [Desulfobacterales bacterium]|nr:hypothetical protein [Desulfobacterales bacterium]
MNASTPQKNSFPGRSGFGAFNPALGYALAISRAQGSRIYDVTGKRVH